VDDSVLSRQLFSPVPSDAEQTANGYEGKAYDAKYSSVDKEDFLKNHRFSSPWVHYRLLREDLSARACFSPKALNQNVLNHNAN
jgi:hypothetical protein